MQAFVLECCRNLAQLREKYDSFNLNYNYLRLQSQAYQISQQYQAAVDICNEAEKYLFEHSHLSFAARRGEFALQKLSCYLNLREYENGVEAVGKCAEIYVPGH